MKNLLRLIIILLFTSCNSQTRTVTFKLDTKDLKDVKNISIRGNINPLSWTKDYLLKDDDNDGIYEATIKFNTSKRNLRFKFVNNQIEELEGSDSRIVWFKKEPVTKEYIFNEFLFHSKKQIGKLKYSNKQISEDVNTLKQIIQYIHPNIYRYRDSIELQNDFQILEKEMRKNPNIVNIYGAVSKFAAKIKCSHTFTNPWNQGPDIKRAIFHQPDKIPFTFKRLGTKLFIDKNASNNPLLKSGLEIVSINNETTQNILTKLSDYITSDGNIYEKKLDRLLVTGEEKFSLFDIFYPVEYGANNQFNLVLKNLKTQEVIETKVKATSKTNRTKILVERYDNLKPSFKDGWGFEFLDNKTAKLSIKSFAIEGKRFDWKKFLKNVFKQLHKKSITNFIIDIRGNEGGQGEVAEYILEHLIQEPFEVKQMQSSVRYLKIPEEFKKHISTWDKFPYDFNGKIKSQNDERYFLTDKYTIKAKTIKPKKNGYKGKTYLITDVSNSSATHQMATYAKHIDGITLVGQETGGNQLGINGGFIFFFRLPNSRVELDIPVIGMHIPTKETSIDGGIKPHIEVKKNIQDLINKRDTELNTILNLIEKSKL